MYFTIINLHCRLSCKSSLKLKVFLSLYLLHGVFQIECYHFWISHRYSGPACVSWDELPIMDTFVEKPCISSDNIKVGKGNARRYIINSSASSFSFLSTTGDVVACYLIRKVRIKPLNSLPEYITDWFFYCFVDIFFICVNIGKFMYVTAASKCHQDEGTISISSSFMRYIIWLVFSCSILLNKWYSTKTTVRIIFFYPIYSGTQVNSTVFGTAIQYNLHDKTWNLFHIAYVSVFTLLIFD